MVADADAKCPCGLPLHYRSDVVRRYVLRECDRLGEHVPVRCGGKTYLVSRHYIALHGLKAAELEHLAATGAVLRI